MISKGERHSTLVRAAKCRKKGIQMTVAEAIELVLSAAEWESTRLSQYGTPRHTVLRQAISIVRDIVLTHYKGVDDDTKGQ